MPSSCLSLNSLSISVLLPRGFDCDRPSPLALILHQRHELLVERDALAHRLDLATALHLLAVCRAQLRPVVARLVRFEALPAFAGRLAAGVSPPLRNGDLLQVISAQAVV